MTTQVSAVSYCRINEPSVTYEWMDGEVIAVNLANGHYFSFTGLSAPVFCALAEQIPLMLLRKELQKHKLLNDVDSQLETWLQLLMDEGLLFGCTDTPTEREISATDWLNMIAVAKPQPLGFEKFTDIEALLALDPVHEISSSGWPEKQQ